MVHSAFGSSVRVFASNVCVIIELPIFVVNVEFVRIIASGSVIIMFLIEDFNVFKVLCVRNDFGTSCNKLYLQVLRTYLICHTRNVTVSGIFLNTILYR